jgi:hypothetical protein
LAGWQKWPKIKTSDRFSGHLEGLEWQGMKYRLFEFFFGSPGKLRFSDLQDFSFS